MSRTYREEKIQTTRRRLVCRRCDLCGREARCEDWPGGTGTYDVNETEVSVTVKQREGHNCPDGGSGQAYEIDLCPDCFKTRLVPWLRSQGANVEQVDWGW